MNSINGIRRTTWTICVLWTLLLAISLTLNILQQERQVLHVARIQAAAFINKDLSLRAWAASHGGVYVRTTPETPPNPYLDMPERDVLTTGGIQLTLMNPAYITREIHKRFAESFGVLGHMTSLQLKNPDNAPDAWERKGLERFAQGNLEDFSEVISHDGKPYLRLMKPMYMEHDCLQCHAWTGIPLGGVRGGINASVPLEAIQKSAAALIAYIAVSHGGMWLIGILAVRGFSVRAVRMQIERESSEASRRELYKLATHDTLTGLFNRRYLDEVLPREIHRASRLASPLSLAMIDIDHFKRFNDEHGHDAGDEVLRQLGREMRNHLRQSDIACRFGGEELAIVIPDAALKEVLPRLEELRVRVGSLRLQNQQELSLPAVTVSIGVAELFPHGDDADRLLKRADQALYRAKAEGRDRVVASGSGAP
ncbi:MAG TPA: diguanylate cyclase [Methylococcaceae bacterium]|nr:diguanylate cyclase [Methylococcaceae bacterium]